ncbi:DUF488 domain-containing protein [Rhizosphaericola mali]|uniref:DUF488 domain-containing protein n=1 Tax=Rhizosphaericola mali TaxID=2545455 RepID=A0A5P2FYY1_9BACT|nr:DUF488 domain-containing protein [Rhizosphaericola mali]QES88754.1 DUF488 domain-containing protein [Rhizosphaericola mali]
MFYRRKLLLGLLEAFDGELDKISLQKLLFLFCNKQGANAEYHFIPYLYGCYSITANSDIESLAKANILNSGEKEVKKLDKSNYISKLKANDKLLLAEVKKNYGRMNAHTLMQHTYLNFKYYAINSVLAQRILPNEAYEKILESRPKREGIILHTIGYEGISLEEYLNKLIRNDIKLLIDVRNNPMSMKFGFSKSQLNAACEKIHIEYLHIPEVGIQSEYRQELKTQADYDNLFSIYRKENLPKTTVQQRRILKLLEEKERIALTCFEANVCQCHRKHLAEAIQNLPGWKYELKHI